MKKEMLFMSVLLIIVGVLAIGWRLSEVKEDAESKASVIACEVNYGKYDWRC